jgi:hypothetical protein
MFPDNGSAERAEQASQVFASMSRLAADNAQNGFGGAFAIIPPGAADQGETVAAMIMLDASHDAAVFWSTLKTKVDIALAELADDPMGRRR